jgi:hypothetical protein
VAALTTAQDHQARALTAGAAEAAAALALLAESARPALQLALAAHAAATKYLSSKTCEPAPSSDATEERLVPTSKEVSEDGQLTRLHFPDGTILQEAPPPSSSTLGESTEGTGGCDAVLLPEPFACVVSFPVAPPVATAAVGDTEGRTAELPPVVVQLDMGAEQVHLFDTSTSSSAMAAVWMSRTKGGQVQFLTNGVEVVQTAQGNLVQIQALPAESSGGGSTEAPVHVSLAAASEAASSDESSAATRTASVSAPLPPAPLVTPDGRAMTISFNSASFDDHNTLLGCAIGQVDEGRTTIMHYPEGSEIEKSFTTCAPLAPLNDALRASKAGVEEDSNAGRFVCVMRDGTYCEVRGGQVFVQERLDSAFAASAVTFKAAPVDAPGMMHTQKRLLEREESRKAAEATAAANAGAGKGSSEGTGTAAGSGGDQEIDLEMKDKAMLFQQLQEKIRSMVVLKQAAALIAADARKSYVVCAALLVKARMSLEHAAVLRGKAIALIEMDSAAAAAAAAQTQVAEDGTTVIQLFPDGTRVQREKTGDTTTAVLVVPPETGGSQPGVVFQRQCTMNTSLANNGGAGEGKAEGRVADDTNSLTSSSSSSSPTNSVVDMVVFSDKQQVQWTHGGSYDDALTVWASPEGDRVQFKGEEAGQTNAEAIMVIPSSTSSRRVQIGATGGDSGGNNGGKKKVIVIIEDGTIDHVHILVGAAGVGAAGVGAAGETADTAADDSRDSGGGGDSFSLIRFQDGSKLHQTSEDGTFVVETTVTFAAAGTAEGAAGAAGAAGVAGVAGAKKWAKNAVHLKPDGLSLNFARADGSQWSFTGTELISVKQREAVDGGNSSGGSGGSGGAGGRGGDVPPSPSPKRARVRLEEAKEMDQAINGING